MSIPTRTNRHEHVKFHSLRGRWLNTYCPTRRSINDLLMEQSDWSECCNCDTRYIIAHFLYLSSLRNLCRALQFARDHGDNDILRSLYEVISSIKLGGSQFICSIQCIYIQITANLTDECEQLACSAEYTCEFIACTLERHEARPRVETPPMRVRISMCTPRLASSAGPRVHEYCTCEISN